ncbi:hypothetical protein H0I39_10555 [Ottowia beijingensis]|uniref:Uncharacterized protein n=1 Tax=Ottowia beijingensis TaxID=1207057 RepID=A0A853IX81_9BURK|nr:hypothetical protein [Ottowia beijingensis]NZA02080.1 hypothetical protein [Ottowia beijingensis]
MTSHLTFRSSHRTLALLLAAALGASGAWAESPSGPAAARTATARPAR